MIGEREAPKAARQVEGLCLGHPKISGSRAQNLYSLLRAAPHQAILFPGTLKRVTKSSLFLKKSITICIASTMPITL